MQSYSLAGIAAELWANNILWVSVIASTLAQFLKPFTYWFKTREWDWHHLSETGGMPSSHSAMVSSLATGVGLVYGFDSALFAISVVLAMIVTYDAGGVRRQAGQHARVINQMVAELLSGHPLEENHLKELLGHSRLEVFAGILFGVAIMLAWKLLIQPIFLR